MKTYALLVCLSLTLSLILTPLVRATAHRFGWLDQPGDRKLHSVPIPRLGGVAIFLAFGLSLAPLIFIHNSITTHLRIGWPFLGVLPVALTCIFLLGLADDIFGVSPYVKLAVELACSVWIFYHGIFVGQITNPLGKTYDVGIWSLPLTVLWLVGITNAFNLVDGIDGLVAGIALFGIGSIALVSMFTGGSDLVALFAALGGATAGFLIFNFHPASIFLGDSGSLFLGFSLASLSLVWGQKSSLVVTVLGPILIFALPIADTLLAIVRRFYAGTPIFAADRDHIHHRLLRLGLSPRKAVLLLYAACFLFGLTTLALVRAQTGAALAILLLVALASWLVLSGLGYHELGEINLTFRRGLLEQRKIIRQRVQLRKATEMIGKANDLPELWNSIQEVARIFDFNYAELILTEELQTEMPSGKASDDAGHGLKTYWKNGSEAASGPHPEKYWKVELPYQCNSGRIGRVVFGRALDKEELHLRMDPFVRLLSSSITKGIAKLQNKRD